MTDSIEDELATLIDAERSRPEDGSARTDRVWKGVQARLDGAVAPASVPGRGGAGFVAGLVIAGGVVAVIGWGAWQRSVQSFIAAAPQPLPVVLAQTLASPRLHAQLDLEPAEVVEEVVEERSERVVQRPRRTVADELALIERARTALAKGRASAALRVLARHRRSFPKGAFAEEAAALRVSALCKAGRNADAQAAATRFGARWPGSVHAARASGCDDVAPPRAAARVEF